MLLRPDDEVYRVDAIWLGPRGLTLPWTARYTAYGIWLIVFVTILLVEAVLPMRVTVPPVWEVVASILATYALMGAIDYERSLTSVVQLIRAEVTAPRVPKPAQVRRLNCRAVHVKERHAIQEKTE